MIQGILLHGKIKINLGESMYRHDLNLVLCKSDGTPMPKSSLFNASKRILRKIGLSEELTIHDIPML